MIKASPTNSTTNRENEGSSVPNSISNYVESGGTVSDITQSPRHQDMIPLKLYQMMETAKKECERKLEMLKRSTLIKSKEK